MALSIIKLQEGKLQESIFIRTVPLYYIKCEKVLYLLRQNQTGRMKRAKKGSERKEAKEMIIYGVALLAGCYMAGNLIGDVLGMALGVNANIGGVGFAMLLLIVISTWAEQKGIMKGPEEAGIKFWASMYIPIVVAMSSIQNVVAALSGGMVAILGGTLAVVLGFLLIPVLSPHHSSEQKMAGKVALNEGKQ